MLFNHQHITTENYAEAFMLYLDGELTPAQMEAVEAFANEHPHLKEELEMLAATKLPDEEVFFLEKESLLSQNISASFIDEDLLLYIDDELAPEQKAKTEERLAADADYNRTAQLLQKTKLDSNDVEVYPYKKELYRRTEKAVPSIAWLRVAVAILLVLGVSVFWFTANDVVAPQQTVALQPAPNGVNNQPETYEKGVDKPVTEATTNLAAVEIKTPQSTKKDAIATVSKTHQKGVTKPATPTNNLPKPDQEDQMLALLDGPVATETNTAKRVPVVLPQQQIINTPAVTSASTPAYTSIDDATAADAGVSHAVTLTNNDKKGSVRGFLRKATRFIERRTGINPVNDDEELLIGVVAIKL